jgi:hypothetical protein
MDEQGESEMNMSAQADPWQEKTNRVMGGGGGIAFGVLTLIGWAAWARPAPFSSLTTAPDVGASVAKITHYYIQHATSARLGALLGTIALLPMLCFVVAMFNRLRDAERGNHPLSSVALLGGLMVCVEHFLFCGFLFQAALNPRAVGAQVTSAWHFAYASGGAAFITYVTFLLAVGVVGLRYRVLPRATAISALVVAPLQLLYLPSSFGQLGIFDPLSGVLGVYVPFGTFLVWCIAAGIALGKVEGAAEEVARTLPLGGSQVVA